MICPNQTLHNVSGLDYDWTSSAGKARFTALAKIIEFTIIYKGGRAFAQAIDKLDNVYILPLGIMVRPGDLFVKSKMTPIDYCFECSVGGSTTSPISEFADITRMTLGNSEYCMLFTSFPGQLFDMVTRHGDKLSAYIKGRQVNINRTEYISLVKTFGIVAGLHPINFISQGKPRGE